jgi:hypothetical protein
MKHTKTVWFYLHFKCPWSHYQLFSVILMLFTALLLQDWVSAFFWKSVGDSSTGMYEIVCTFQWHSQSYGSVPLTTAFLYVAVLNKISSCSFNQVPCMYFGIYKIDRIETWNNQWTTSPSPRSGSHTCHEVYWRQFWLVFLTTWILFMLSVWSRVKEGVLAVFWTVENTWKVTGTVIM